MKNQTDMIISIVAIVLALITAGILIGTKPQPKSTSQPTTVVVTPPVVAGADVVRGNALPNAGSGGQLAGGSGGAGAPGGGRRGGPMSLGGIDGRPSGGAPTGPTGRPGAPAATGGPSVDGATSLGR